MIQHFVTKYILQYLNLVFVQHYIDINECSDTTLCDQICVEVKGSYRCRCENGFRLQTDGRTCAGTAELDHNKHNTQLQIQEDTR